MEETKRVEKRRFVRLETTIPVKYRACQNDSIFSGNFSVGRSKNISAGGLKLAVGRHNPIDTKLDMEMELPNNVLAYTTAKVLGGNDEQINGITHRFDRVVFLEMDDDVQGTLTRYVFEGLRKKGMNIR
ncbi:MAG TPA: PilZ domain-containing protein [bacterium]|nr:PilZ domain-containing protein [bacterium]